MILWYVLKRNSTQQKQILDLFAYSLQLQRNEGHLLQLKYNKLVDKISKICAQSTSYLPIHVNGSDNQHGQTNDISITYIGHSPLVTSNEILAKKLKFSCGVINHPSSHRQVLFILIHYTYQYFEYTNTSFLNTTCSWPNYRSQSFNHVYSHFAG